MSSSGIPPRGSVQRTPRIVIAVAALMGAGITWIGVTALESFAQPVPRIPLATAIIVGALAVLVGVLAWDTHRHIQVRRAPMEASRAVALLVLGKTAVIAGAGLAAAYLTLALLNLPRLDAPLPRERVVASGLAALASAGVGVAGWFLEGACRVPGSDDDTGETPGGEDDDLDNAGA